MSEDARHRLLPRVVTSQRLLELEHFSSSHGYSQNVDPEWLETVLAPAGHHVMTPGFTHPAQTPDEDEYRRTMVRIQLRDNLPWTEATAMQSLLDLPFEVFESLPEPSVEVLNWIAELATERSLSQAQIAELQDLAGARPNNPPGVFPIWGTIVWFTPDQGGRRSGVPPTLWDTYYHATAFVPPSPAEAGLASVIVDVSVRSDWQSHAKLRWLTTPGPAVARGSCIIITEGPRPVALFMVSHVADGRSGQAPPMSGQRLAEIEDRQAAASPGPWASSVEGRDHDSGDDFILTGSEGYRGVDLYLTWDPAPDEVQRHADQDFLAEARQDVPDMAAEIRRLWGLLDLLPRDSGAEDPPSGDCSAPEGEAAAVYVVETNSGNDVCQLGAFTSRKEAVKAMDQAQVHDPAAAWVINHLPVYEQAQDYLEDR